MLPDNTYICLVSVFPQACTECDVISDQLVVANEFIYDGELFGIEAVVRFDECGHVCDGAVADPVTVALLSDHFEDLHDADE